MSPKEATTKKVGIYCRVSQVGGRDVESDGGSVAEQEKRCRAALESKGLKVGKVYVDKDVSGGKVSRPEFDKLLASIEDGEHGGLVTLNMSRFGRHLRVEEQILALEEIGATVILVEDSLDTSTASGRMMVGLLARINAYYLDQKREEWALKHATMFDKGVQVGAAAIGYTRGESGTYEPNEWAPVIAEAFRLKATGATLAAVARRLNEAGAPTRSGNLWTSAGARQILANRTYLGEIRYGEKVKKNVHPAIVDERTFRLANGSKKREGYVRGDGPLLGGGLLRCGVCGMALVKHHTTSGGKRYEFFRCSSQAKGHVTISKRKVERVVLAEAVKRIEAGLANEVGPVAVDVAVPVQLVEEFDMAVAEVELLEQQLEAGEISPSIYAKAAAVAEADRDRLAAEIETVEKSGKAKLRPSQYALVEDITLLQTGDLISGDLGDVSSARALLKDTLGKVTILAGSGDAEQRVVFEPVKE